MALTTREIERIYETRAPLYDFTANLYYLLGYREMEYRRRAITELDPRPGQTVVELCCGTGLNFRLIEQKIGAAGRLIGVDFSEGMLRQAKRRVERMGWQNVELVHHDVATFHFPAEVDRVLSTFALTVVPQYDLVIARAHEALSSGGKLVLLDLKKPEGKNESLVRLAAMMVRPFAVTLDLAARHPWESVARYFEDCRLENLYFGFTYIVSGWKGAPEA